MPSLLQKLSYYDADTGRQFVVADDGFYWKQAKKAPEESKVTALMQRHGWQLSHGNDVWLIFKRPRQRGEVTVTRGTKEWYYDMPGANMFEAAAEGRGLDSLQEALETGKLGGKAMAQHASAATTAVNSAGSPRQIMHDDFGALTGLRSRPDYGESDACTTEMNEANSKAGAVVVLEGGKKTASGAKKAELYVSGVKYEQGNPFKLASFRFSPDLGKALVLPKITATNLVRQIRGFHGTVAKVVKQADESSLNGFSIMSLDDFVKQGASRVAAESGEENGEEIQRDEPATAEKPKTDDKQKEEFGLGSKYRELPEKEMREYMDRIKKKERDPHDKFNYPYIHGSNIHIVDDGGKEYDLDDLKKQITVRPSSLLRKNEKMQHSDGTTEQFYNVGLPALKGLVVNEKTGKFVIVDTCPGAGACKTYCYAMRGSYVQFGAASMSQAKVLNFLVNHPDKFAARLKAEIGLAISDVDEETKVIVRWHDAGDFFSPQYLKMAFDVARAFPDVQFYAYTKLADVAKSKKPDNFIFNWSEGALPSETKKVDLTQIK